MNVFKWFQVGIFRMNEFGKSNVRVMAPAGESSKNVGKSRKPLHN